MPLLQKPSPNFSPRRCGPVDILLLHYTGMKSCEEALARLCDPAAEVSAHYTVAEDGTVYQHVNEAMRAHHAGLSFWAGESDINSRSIGIEICNPGHEFGYRDFPKKQIGALVALCRDILCRHPIPPQRVLGHSDVAPSRKQDPGEKFPWALMAKNGIGHFVTPAALNLKGASFGFGDAGAHVGALQRMLSIYGYGVEVSGAFDEKTRDAVAAFQRHFRPKKVDGIADPSTVATLHKLLQELPGA